MSKKNLDKILSDISSRVQTFREQELDNSAHVYSVLYPKLLREVLYEINTIKISGIRFPASLIREPVKTYCEELYTSFKKTAPPGYSMQVAGTPLSFSVLIRKKGASDKKSTPFIQIGARRKVPLSNLKITLLREIKAFIKESRNRAITKIEEERIFNTVLGNKDKNNIRAGGLLERGHSTGGSAIEHELLDAKISFSEELRNISKMGQSSVVDSILMDMKFTVITNPKKQGKLRNGKLVVFIYDQSKTRNNAQSNVESNMRKDFQKVIMEVLDKVDFANLETSPSVPKIAIAKIGKGAKKSGLKTNINTAIADITYNTVSNTSIKGKLLTTTISENLSSSMKFNFVQANKAQKKQNWSYLIPIINSRLASQVQKNMKSPRLVNRTGRFANSVSVTGVVETQQGYPSFIFDYERDPYNVFDPVVGRSPWNTPERNPRNLINLSIREIMRELAVDRFYTRRA